MKVLLGALLVGLLAMRPALAAELDPLYFKTFGTQGANVVSTKGLPAKDTCDPSLCEFKGTTFFVPRGAGTTIDIRSFLPEGKKLGDYVDRLVKEKPQNL